MLALFADKNDSLFEFSPEIQSYYEIPPELETDDVSNDGDKSLSLHSSLKSVTIDCSRKSSLESVSNLIVNKAIMTILEQRQDQLRGKSSA